MTRNQAPYRASTVATQGSELGNPATSCARWIRAAAGGERATVRVATPDASGRLQVIACEGHDVGAGRMRSRRRRTVFQTLSPVRMSLQDDLTLGIFPLVSDGAALGVVEITAPGNVIRDREDVLVALIGQSALLLTSAGIRSEAERALAGMSATLRLASEMQWAQTPTEAVRLTVDACAQHLGSPIVGLLPDRDGWGWFLAATHGLGVRRRGELRMALNGMDTEPGRQRPRLSALRLHFRNVTRSREVTAQRAGAAVLLIGDVPPGSEDYLSRAGTLLGGVLRRIRETRPNPDQVSELGIAWTAHELRGPLVGARAALEQATETSEHFEGRELLRRTKEELRQLSELIDPLLRWSPGGQTLERARADLVEVTRAAIASPSLELGEGRVSLDAPDRLLVDVDHWQLRSAIANVVRNALAYSPPEGEVNVTIESSDRYVRVVVHDHGPGIPQEERRQVFDPFSRGRTGRATRSGSGLGLFIARRVLEAHGGSISLRPARSGATFVLELPFSMSERRERSAS